MGIELTDDQVRALENGVKPTRLVNPRTCETFVLVSEDVYERLRKAMDAEPVDPSFFEFEGVEEHRP